MRRRRILATVKFVLPQEELRFRASRSSGPGGQHVNRASTRVEVLWNVKESRSLSEKTRRLILERLAHRIDGSGILRVVSSSRRSQHRNRQAAVRRMEELVSRALVVPKPRKPTRPPESAERSRLEVKRRRAEIKRSRSKVKEEE